MTDFVVKYWPQITFTLLLVFGVGAWVGRSEVFSKSQKEDQEESRKEFTKDMAVLGHKIDRLEEESKTTGERLVRIETKYDFVQKGIDEIKETLKSFNPKPHG